MLSAVPVFGSSTKARIRLSLRVVSSPASAVQAARGLRTLSLGAVRLFPLWRAAQAARGPGALSRMRRAFSVRGEQLGQPEACAHFPQMRCAFSLCGPKARRWSGLRKSLDRNRGPVCRVGGGGFSGPEFAPFPSPLPPTSSGDGPALLWSFSVPLFCEPSAVCSGRLIFPCYPTV